MNMSNEDWYSFNCAELYEKELVHVSENNSLLLKLTCDEADNRWWVYSEWTCTCGFYNEPTDFEGENAEEEAYKYFYALFDELYDPETDDEFRHRLGYNY